jgi:ADP-heptose:LPS heptosyltransferase
VRRAERAEQTGGASASSPDGDGSGAQPQRVSVKALPSRLLVARLDNAGDVLLSGPAVRAAAAAGPVTYLAGPAGAEAARLLPGVAEVVTFDAPWVGYQPPAVDGQAVGDLLDRIRAVSPDAALVLTSFHQSPLPLALLLRLAGVHRIAAISEDYPGSLLDKRVPDDPARHEVEQSLAVAAALGLALPGGDDGRLAVRPPPTEPALDRSTGSPYVVVHPGASVAARALPIGLATATVAALAERGWHVAVTGSRGEADLVAQVAGPVATRGRGPTGRVHAMAGAVDLAGLAELLRGASALVSGNTGPVHLAAAVGTPVVEVFAPVVAPDRWLPWKVPSVLLGDLGVDCAGCRARRCPLPVQRCVAGVDATDVVAAVERLAGDPRAGEPLAESTVRAIPQVAGS